MSKNKSISIDENLLRVFEAIYKKEGDTWNDVIARLCDCKDYTGFLNVSIVVETLKSKQRDKELRCNKTHIRCDKTIDWVEEVNDVNN